MIVGLGTDVVDMTRIENVLKRTGQTFIKRIIHSSEHYDYEGLLASPASAAHVRFVASRFAAKEAAAKALGTGFTMGVAFIDIRVHSAENGKPNVRFYNRTAEIASQLQATQYHLSITHEKNIAMATVILESLDRGKS